MLRLRPYKKCDAEKIVSWIKDEESFMKWSAGRLGAYPLSAKDLNAHYGSYADNDGFFEMSMLDGNSLCGHLIMRFTDEQKRCLRFGFVVVDDSVRGKGYGRAMIKLAFKFAFELLAASEVSIMVFENNLPAIRCYEKAGFRKVSKYLDVIEFGSEKWNLIEMKISVEEYHAMCSEGNR